MNKETMLEIAELIENAPKEQFHMGSWFGEYPIDYLESEGIDDWNKHWDSLPFSPSALKLVFNNNLPNQLSCGTTACIAGWAYADMKRKNLPINDYDSIEDLAREHLGLSRNEAKALFYCNTDSVWYDVARQYDFDFDPDFCESWNLESKKVADVLRRIANGDIDLSMYHGSTCDCDECYLNYSNDDEEDVF